VPACAPRCAARARSGAGAGRSVLGGRRRSGSDPWRRRSPLVASTPPCPHRRAPREATRTGFASRRSPPARREPSAGPGLVDHGRELGCRIRCPSQVQVRVAEVHQRAAAVGPEEERLQIPIGQFWRISCLTPALADGASSSPGRRRSPRTVLAQTRGGRGRPEPSAPRSLPARRCSEAPPPRAQLRAAPPRAAPPRRRPSAQRRSPERTAQAPARRAVRAIPCDVRASSRGMLPGPLPAPSAVAALENENLRFAEASEVGVTGIEPVTSRV
jgi:hypothetical protein